MIPRPPVRLLGRRHDRRRSRSRYHGHDGWTRYHAAEIRHHRSYHRRVYYGTSRRRRERRLHVVRAEVSDRSLNRDSTTRRRRRSSSRLPIRSFIRSRTMPVTFSIPGSGSSPTAFRATEHGIGPRATMRRVPGSLFRRESSS
jgi:hypothetical protein